MQRQACAVLTHIPISSIIASYSPLYLVEICTWVLTGLGSQTEVEMLRQFIMLLDEVTDFREKSYNQRLRQLVAIVFETIDSSSTGATQQQHKRRKTGLTMEQQRPSSSHSSQQQSPDRYQRGGVIPLHGSSSSAAAAATDAATAFANIFSSSRELSPQEIDLHSFFLSSTLPFWEDSTVADVPATSSSLATNPGRGSVWSRLG